MFHTNRLFSVYYQIIKGICRAQDLKEIKIKWIVVKTGDLNRFGGGGESYEFGDGQINYSRGKLFSV